MNIKRPVFDTGIWVIFSYTPVGKQKFNFGNLLFTWEENGLQQLTSDGNILLSVLTYITESLIFCYCWCNGFQVICLLSLVSVDISVFGVLQVWQNMFSCLSETEDSSLSSIMRMFSTSLMSPRLLFFNSNSSPSFKLSESSAVSLRQFMFLLTCVVVPFFAFNSVYHTSDIFITFSIFYPHNFIYFLHIVLHGIFKHFTHSGFDNLPYLPPYFTCIWYTSDSSTWISTGSNFRHFTIFADLPWGCLVPYRRLFVLNYEVIHTKDLCIGSQQTLKL